MKKIRLIFMGIVLVAVVLAGSSSVSAQALDGTWFKLKVSAKGYSVGMGEVISKASMKMTVYLNLMWDAGDGNYDCDSWCETSPGSWTSTFLDGVIDREFCTEEYIFMQGMEWSSTGPDGAYIYGYLTGLIKSKFDKSDELSKATFSSLGYEVYDSTTPDGDDFSGGGKVKGKLVDAAKLPFTPI